VRCTTIAQVKAEELVRRAAAAGANIILVQVRVGLWLKHTCMHVRMPAGSSARSIHLQTDHYAGAGNSAASTFSTMIAARVYSSRPAYAAAPQLRDERLTITHSPQLCPLLPVGLCCTCYLCLPCQHPSLLLAGQCPQKLCSTLLPVVDTPSCCCCSPRPTSARSSPWKCIDMRSHLSLLLPPPPGALLHALLLPGAGPPLL
jgi:hypothetical protein